VHVRQGEFVTPWVHRYTTREKVAELISSALTNYRLAREKLSVENTSVLLLGDDARYLGKLRTLLASEQGRKGGVNVAKDASKIHQFTAPTRDSGMEELCFTIEHCDSFLAATSSSTYAWWIAYLMQEGMSERRKKGDWRKRVIFFNGDLHEPYARDNFPDDWVML